MKKLTCALFLMAASAACCTPLQAAGLTVLDPASASKIIEQARTRLSAQRANAPEKAPLTAANAQSIGAQAAQGKHAEGQAVGKIEEVGLPSAPPQALAQSALGQPGAPARAQRFQVTASDGVLRHALERWASIEGVQLEWELDRDHVIAGDADFGASFAEALRRVLESTALSDVPLRACLHAQEPRNLVRIVRLSAACQ